MSKARNTGNLNNSIQISDTGTITFVSGSTTLLAISSSGAVTTTGVISGSNALSASFAATASFVANAVSSSFATTASSADNFLARGTITAQTLVVQTITSSVDFVTGSTRFGSTGSNTMQVTGSILVTGSIKITDNPGVDYIGFGAGNTAAKYAYITSTFEGAQKVGLGIYTTSDAGATNQERVRITDTGSVGIGISSPTARLHVSGTTGGVFEVDGASAVTALYVSASGNIGASTSTPNRLLTVNGDSSLFNGTDSTGAISPGSSEIITLGFNLAASETRDISNINLTADKWKAIVRGGFANNNEGGGLVSPSLEIEVDSNNATIDVGSTDITFSRNATTSKLQVTNGSATNRVTFVGTIQVINYAQSALPTVSKIMLNNVGIGTISPSARLHISSSAAASTIFRVDTAASNGTLFVSSSGRIGIGNTNPTETLFLQDPNRNPTFGITHAGGGAYFMKFQQFSGWNQLMTFTSTATFMGINTSGPLILNESGSNVGIGTISPSALLQVGTNSTGQSSGDNSTLVRFGSGSVGGRVYPLTLANTATPTAGNESALSFIVGSNYSATAIITAINRNSSTALTDLSFTTYSGSLNERMRILGNGNVGIGTTDPEAALEIRKLSQTIPSIYFSGKSSYDGTEAKGLAITHYYSDTGTNRQLAIYNPNYTNYPYIRFVVSNINYAAINAITGSTASLKGLYLNDSLYVASGGSVGIGTTSPTTKLHVVGAIGNGLSSYPHNARLVKTGTTSVTFTINIPYASNWNPGYATVRVAGSRTGLEEQYAALYFVRLTYYAGSTSSIVYNVAGDTGNATVSVSSSAPSNSVVTITITDSGSTTDYIIADVDACFNGGIISMA